MPRVLDSLTSENKKLFGGEKYHVNPTGKFVIGGPHGDTGLIEKLLLTLMEEKELTEEVHFLVKIHQKLIDQPHTLQGILQKILLQLDYVKEFLYK